MSGAQYIIGTDQYVEFEIECSTKGYTFDAADWDIEAILVPLDGTYDPETVTWAEVAVVVVDSVPYGQVLLSEMFDELEVGKYRVLCKATATGSEREAPLFVAKGLVQIIDPFSLLDEDEEEPVP
jgi:hypothetical protein